MGTHSQTYRGIHPHTDTLACAQTDTHVLFAEKDTHPGRHSDTHTKTHRCAARPTQAEPWRQRGFERGQPASRTQTSQLCSPPRNPVNRQEKFLGY